MATDIALIEKALVKGDLSALTSAERTNYYANVCTSLGLNPLTKPFEYLLLKAQGGGKRLVLYATRSAADQLRAIHNVTLAIVDRKTMDGVHIVTARATTPEGRSDESTGAVPIEREDGRWVNGKFEGNGKMVPFRGEMLANALMKAETKAKRRVTLSICGLGMLDETEVDSIPEATWQPQIEDKADPNHPTAIQLAAIRGHLVRIKRSEEATALWASRDTANPVKTLEELTNAQADALIKFLAGSDKAPTVTAEQRAMLDELSRQLCEDYAWTIDGVREEVAAASKIEDPNKLTHAGAELAIERLTTKIAESEGAKQREEEEAIQDCRGDADES